MDYIRCGQLPLKQRGSYEKKCAMLQQHTDDAEMLSHTLVTATNLSELAEEIYQPTRG